MKFLLTALNAKYIHSNPAIYSLRAHAGAELQEHIELAEYTINQAFTDILADIYRRKPDVIGFSCYIWNITMILELVTELHKILPKLPIWLGGPEVSFDAPGLLEKYPMITGVMIGEGEETFKELLQFYMQEAGEQGKAQLDAGAWDCPQAMESNHCIQEACEPDKTVPDCLSRISGLCLPGGFTMPRSPADLSSLPFLYSNLEAFENKIIYYESSRGCPFRCSYCLSSIDKKVRLRDLNIVKKELQFFLDHNVKQVKFVDRTFNCNHNHAMEIWKYILEHDNGVTNFHFEVSADILNEEEIAILNRMRPGLVQLEIGVQSTKPDTIKAINRTMNVDKLERIVRSINMGHNVHQHLDLIAGLPYEDYESFGNSFNRVYAMEPEQLQLGFLKVLKGSQMYEKAAEYGICYMDKPPYEVLYTKWLSFGEVLKLKRVEEMVELYYNSNQFRHTLSFLVKQFESPFAMYEKLAEFYERKGYFINSPARVYRYHVLLEFAMEQDIQGAVVTADREPGDTGSRPAEMQLKKNIPAGMQIIYEEICRELLTYDMYLRENLKSRPDFAKDLAPYKDIIRGFFQKEEQERIYLPDYGAYDHKQLAKMTHLEPFKYPVWDMNLWERFVTRKSDGAQCAESLPDTFNREATSSYILFDYRNRSPLTSDARTVRLQELV